jgi:hypothetical protein
MEESVAVIPGSLGLDIGRKRKAMVRNGECGAEQRSEGLTSAGWLEFVS